PFDQKWLRPASYVLHLGKRWRRWTADSAPIEIWSERAYQGRMGEVHEGEALVIEPGEFVVATTLEHISTPRELGGMLAPLSHIARTGLQVHLGAFWINPGFGANDATALAMELVNHNPSPIVLRAGLPICHLLFCPIAGVINAAHDELSMY